MRVFLIAFFLISVAASGITVQNAWPRDARKEISPIGRWHVKFSLIGGAEKNLVLSLQEKGTGSFDLLDTGPDNNAVPAPLPAAWSKTGDNLSISGEAELPTGTCCRENGTLILKAKVVSENVLSGRIIFVTNIDEDESPYKFHATIGTFSATRVVQK
jgi:hypothetical protein